MLERNLIVQARDSVAEKRSSGGDRFSLSVIMVNREDVRGRGTIVDLQNGLYSASYAVPMPGDYDVHVTHLDLGSETPFHVRGSPFRIRCADPWIKPRILGSVPQKRKAATLLPVGDDIVLYGGEKGKPYVLNTSSPDWRWMNISFPEGTPEPRHRTAHGACLSGSNALVIFAGIALDDQSELSDVWKLTNVTGEWSWSSSPSSLGFKRELKRLRALEGNKVPEPQSVPSTGIHVQLTLTNGSPFWLDGHKFKEKGEYKVEVTGANADAVKSVKFYLNSSGEEGTQPTYVATSPPFVMGSAQDGSSKRWTFEEGEVVITVVAEPADGGQVTKVTERGTVLPAKAVEV